jgi:outer membrane immunogenic protein
MKILVLGAGVALALAVSGSAFAADLPVRPRAAAPTPAPVTNWTGFYVNGGFGYGMWTADTTTLDPTTGVCDLCITQRQGGRGWLGTIGGGFDYQLRTGLPWVFPTVFGAFADYDFADIKGTIQDQNPFFSGETKLNHAWSAGARAGWLVTPSTMSYVNGGYTQAHFTSASMVNNFAGAATSFSTPGFTKGGWFIGGGVETTFPNFLPGLFWRTEYRYADYGTATLTDTSPGGAFVILPGVPFGELANPQDNITFHPIVQTIRTELVYKFNWSPTGGAYAAYVPAQPAVPAPVSTWTGLYVNGGFGYGMWTADTTTVDPATGVCVLCVPQRQGGRGWLGTIGGGFDYQLHSGLPWVFPTVFGAFADFDFASLKGTIQDQFPFFAGETKLDRAWSVGGRAGWVVTPGTMSYVNGGWTEAHFTGANMVDTFTGLSTTFSTPAFTKGGWFIGGGVETTFPNLLPGLFWRTEYRYADYGTRTLTDTAPGGPFVTLPVLGIFANPQDSITFHPIVQTIRTELVYKFNWWR